ncbi:MAG: YfcC family protein, partial [Clostridia bacterium]|nr:YfcC family protein [Clostridia bacterium]
TNVLFPTSPVLLISLSMIEVDYFAWVKKSLPLFLLNLLAVLLLIGLGIVIGY